MDDEGASFPQAGTCSPAEGFALASQLNASFRRGAGTGLKTVTLDDRIYPIR